MDKPETIRIKEQALQEAKDFFDSIENGMANTKNKCWQLTAFMLAVDVYLVKQVIENHADFTLQVLTMVSLCFNIIIFYYLYIALTPSVTYAKGAAPDDLKRIMQHGEEQFYDNLLATYQKSTDENKAVLSKIVKNYRRSLVLIFVYVIVCLLTFVLMRSL